MDDIALLLTFWASAYGVVGLGIAVALLLRRVYRFADRPLSPASASSLAFLPLAALLVSAGFARLPVSASPHPSFHEPWHGWMDRLPTLYVAHCTLHGANALLLLFAAGCIGRAVFTGSRILAFGKSLRSLSHDTETRGGLSCRVLDTDGCHCFTAGIARPQVYVSRGLLEKLAPRDAVAMLAHEEAHVRRRDGFTGAVLTLFYRLFPLPGGGTLCRDWTLAAERDCDAQAARRVGNPGDVAAALVTVAGMDRTPPVPAPGFALSSAEDLEGRVHALLALPEDRTKTVGRDALVSAVAVLLCLGMMTLVFPYLSHAVESFARH